MAEPTRRHVVTGGLALAAGLAAPGLLAVPAAASAAAGAPPVLPGGTTATLQVFRNWSGEEVTAPVWTCSARDAAHLVALANWAATAGWRLRPRGYGHTWSPLVVEPGATAATTVLLVDTTAAPGLRGVAVTRGADGPVVTAGAGASMDAVLDAVDAAGYGILHHPAPGDITVAGALAIGGHGTGVAARGERRAPGHTYGSLSSLVVALDVVAWNAQAGRFELRTIRRDDPVMGALLCHLGRALVTSVTLALGPRQNLRCRSTTLVPTATLLAAPGSAGTTLASLLEVTGRVEIIHFPFTTCAWLKTWQVSPAYPLGARPVVGPYNYPFSDRLPDEVTSLVAQIQTGHPAAATLLGPAQLDIVRAGLLATASADLWGHAPDVLRYVRPTTLRVTANGYAVLCARADVQRAAHDFWMQYTSLVDRYRARGLYPMNGPLEVRVTGLDDPSHSPVAGAADPWLAPTRRRPDRPDLDCAVWFDVLTLPGTPGAAQFYAELEAWLFAHFTGWADVRVEWSKGWGYTEAGAWTDADLLRGAVPASLTRGQPAGEGFADAAATLGRLDPQGVFGGGLVGTMTTP